TRVSEADLDRYYQEYKDYFDGTRVRVSHIVLRMPAGATADVKAKIHAQLTALRAQLLEGKITFADAARMYSHCPSASKGGALDYSDRLGMVEESFAHVAFGLQVNQISDVVETEFGLHLIWVTDRKPGQQPADYTKIKEELRERCAQELWQKILAEQRKSAKI